MKPDVYLPTEVDPNEVPGRIDYVFVHPRYMRVKECKMVCEDKWYSDHKAVVATLTWETRANSVVKSPCVVTDAIGTPTLALRVVRSGTRLTWLLSARHLTGEKNHYIEMWAYGRDTSVCRGWFYVDGLQSIKNCLLLENASWYTYGTWPTAVDHNESGDVYTHWQAVLFTESKDELLRTERVCVEATV
jgi:hypothetical protein